AGKLLFHVPTFDDANPFGAELFRISAAASLTIGAEGLSMFAKGDLEIGPPEIRLLDIDALGVFIINDEGFAGDMQVSVAVGDIPAIRDYFQFDVSARVVFNVTGQNQEVKILDRFMDFLTPDFQARLEDCSEQPPEGVTSTFSNAATKCYVVGAAPPPRPKAPPAPAGPYVVIMAEGNLMIAEVFRMHGDFYFELNSRPEMFVTVNASLALDPLGAVVASGTLHIDEHGAYGGLQLGGSLDLGPLKIFGAAQFEFNTQDFTATVERYKFDFVQRRVTDEREEVVLTPGAFRIHVAGFLGIEGAFQLQGQFLLENQTDVIAVHIDAKFDAFGANLLYVNGDAAIVKHGDTGFVCNVIAMMQSPIQLDGIFEMSADFRLKMNTRGGSGSDAYDLGVNRGSFFVSFDGDLKLLSLIDMHGHGFIEYDNGLFRMEVAMGFELLGSGVDASGFFSSEGEFELYVAGHLQIGFPGFGVRGDASFYISRLDDNGKDPYGDLNFAFNVYGSIGAQLELFGITLAGVNVSFGYNQDNGRVWIKPCVQLLFWEACSDFTIMYIKPPPKVYLAGNVDDVEGTAFHGGELYLNMGPRAYLRNEQTDNIHEGLQVEAVGPDPDNGGEIVRVKSMGRSQTFRGVTKIIAD
ncbi:MAG TPA: hypothetical protein PLV92_18670, partial [Pirellulaceae bacterium]|nr:hypothetical protein [Pirellulaceae bacterium]